MKFSTSIVLVAAAMISGGLATPTPISERSVPIPPQMAREDFVTANLVPKLLALNNWILGGKLAGGGTPAYRSPSLQAGVQRGYYFSPAVLNIGPTAPPLTALNELAKTALSIAHNQIFLDGNHRTATLAIVEYLASVGVQLRNSPARIYDILAKKDLVNNDANTIAAVLKELKQNTKPAGGLPASYRQSYFEAIQSAESKYNKN